MKTITTKQINDILTVKNVIIITYTTIVILIVLNNILTVGFYPY